MMNNDNQIISFGKYVENYEKQYYIKKTNKKKYLHRVKDDCIVSIDYLNIIDVTLLEVTESKKIFLIEFEWKNELKRLESEVYTDWKATKLGDIKHIKYEMDISLSILKKREYLALLRRYILHALKSYTFNKVKLGWARIDNELQYIPISSVGCWSDNSDVMHKYKEIEQLEKSQEELLNGGLEILSLFDERPCLYLFSYIIYSITYYWYDYLKDDNVDKGTFAICAYGTDIDKIKGIVNIFSNFLPMDLKHKARINKYNSFSATSLKTDRGYHISYSPVVVTTKSNIFNKNRSIVRSIYREQSLKKILYSPIYVSLKPIKADEVIDINVDSVVKILDYPNIGSLKDQFNMLLISFIKNLLYFTTHRRMNDSIQQEFTDILSMQEPDVEGEELYNYRLYRAILFFCHFLRYKCNNSIEADNLQSTAKKVFMDKDSMLENMQETTNAVTNVIQYFASYISYMNDKSSKPYVFYLAAEPKAENRSQCYFLEFDKYYDDFCKYTRETYGICISESKLKKTLRDNGLLFMRKSGKQYGVQRLYNDKKLSFLIVYKDKIEEYINSELY